MKLIDKDSFSALLAKNCLRGGGEMGAMMRATDWARSPVGPVASWSPSFRSMVGLVLRNGSPLCMWWGPELVQFYNDPFRPTLGAKHPTACGQSGKDCWAEIWHIIGPMIEGPFFGGPAAGAEELPLLIHRNGFFEETHFRVAYSPIPDETVVGTGVGGVLATVSETTGQVFAERQVRTLRELGLNAARSTSVDDACQSATATLAGNSADVPFSLLYVFDDSAVPRLVSSSGFRADHDSSSDAGALFPLAAAVANRRVEVVGCTDARFGSLPMAPWAEPPRNAIVIPLAASDQAHPYGVMVAGLNPHRQLDEGYRSFIELAAAQVVTAIRNARAYEEDRRHVAALAALDRQKTEFFSNVSHEFRTPLALMIGPTQDALASSGRSLHGDALEMVHRNELRLLKLVNSLLDFSRVEAGRLEASFQATDLARLTSDLASQFRAVMDKAGMDLIVDTPPLSVPAFVDRGMWEKIVLNLLSNAFKHTFAGTVTIRLSTVHESIQLSVRDTGIGITAEELPRIFDRFHRVREAHARSHEGTGIGLALARDLVKLHGGKIEVESETGVGTCFTVTLPAGSAHLPADRIGMAKELASAAVGSAAYINDALSWLPPDDADRVALAVSDDGAGNANLPHDAPARLVLADDNADMREYLRRLLTAHWTVETVADGQQALDAIHRQLPDLLVSDVMMPRLDGLELTRQLREDATTRHLPVILLSARTGEEATSEGLAIGANDYIVKPFSARELIARIRVQLEVSQSRAREQRHQIAEAASHAKDEFLAVLGHELRNPLAPIQTALDLMNLRNEPGSLKERAIIGRQVTHMVRLVDDLLDVSRITRGVMELEKQSMGIDVVIASAVEMASPLIQRRKHQLVVTCPPGLEVLVDPSRIAQVLSNLLINAAKFTDPGGVITVSARRDGPQVVISVKDTGIGIEPARLATLFDAFAQGSQASDRSQGGLGLGLTIARSLVALHGGQVEAHSAGRGRGSELVVRLPAATDAASLSAPAEARASVQPGRPGLRVLVVDDNRDAADLLATALRHVGDEVVVAYDGHAALEARATFEPEVALLDIGLPGMDGYELARRLRASAPPSGLQIIALSGYAEARDRERSKAAGFDEHLVKPINLQVLREMLASARPPMT